MKWLWIAVLAGTAVVVAGELNDGDLAMGVVYAVLGLALTIWLSPWRGGKSTTHAGVARLSESEWPVVAYWRPGCAYCASLRVRLGLAGRRVAWVNIWQDPEAAEFVRSVNDGNETVPTVVIDGEAVTNPPPRLVLERLRG